MVDPIRARSLLARNRGYRRYLDRLSERSDEELLGDFVAMGAVHHYLLLLIESALDLASHAISSQGWEPPASYADTFRVLKEEGVIPSGLAVRLMAMARFRNLLVHHYAEVDDVQVIQILRGELDDVDALVEAIRHRFRSDLEEGG